MCALRYRPAIRRFTGVLVFWCVVVMENTLHLTLHPPPDLTSAFCVFGGLLRVSCFCVVFFVWWFQGLGVRCGVLFGVVFLNLQHTYNLASLRREEDVVGG